MANEKNPAKIVLGTHRISYVHIDKPTSFEDESTPKYDCTFLIPKDHPDVEKIENAIAAIYKANKESVFKGKPITSPKMWQPLRDGDEWLEEHPEATEYEGMYFLKAATKSQPQVYDVDKNEIFDVAGEVYSGMYARGVIVGYPFNNKSYGFGFYLNSIMKIKDGERLGGFAASPDDYDEDETPVKKRGAAKKAAPAKSKRIFDVDAEGDDIYSDDGGENWFYLE